MYKFKFKLVGVTSVFIHQDDVRDADRVSQWRKLPQNKSVAHGDDRFPSWTWKTYLYSDGERVCIPSANLMAALRKGGAEFSLQGSRKSLKAASQSCIRIIDEFLPISTHAGNFVTTEQIDKIGDDLGFEGHATAAEKLKFVLDCRRATMGTSKHVRVRPKFLPGWSVSGEGIVTDGAKIPLEQLASLFGHIGDYVGIGDWRPGAPKSPGTHGRFSAEVVLIP
jgi:hypothetical protein